MAKRLSNIILPLVIQELPLLSPWGPFSFLNLFLGRKGQEVHGKINYQNLKDEHGNLRTLTQIETESAKQTST